MTTRDHVPTPRELRSYDAVAFDMDGLLVDTEPLWWRAEAEVAHELGGSWSESDSQACVGGPMTKVADIIIASAGGGDREAIITAVIDRVIALLRTQPVRWLPGALELLIHLQAQGVPHALVSASPRPIVDGVLRALASQAESLQFSISADDVSNTKPAPDPYLEAARRFGCQPSRLVVFEDSPTGTTAAIASGAYVVAVPHVSGVTPHPRLHVTTTLLGLTVGTIDSLVRDLKQQIDAETDVAASR